MFYADESSYIPTTGLPSSVIDYYRAHHLIVDEYVIDNPGFIDYRRCNDLAIFESEINSIDDILKFESLIRFVVLQDRIDVLTPSIKTVNNHNGHLFSGYSRIDEERKESSLLVLQQSGAHDFMFPSEKITIENNIVISSTYDKSDYLGKNQTEIKDLLSNDPFQEDLLNALPSSLSIPFVSNQNNSSSQMNIIFDDYIKSLNQEWHAQTSYTVLAGYNIELPFFTNAILGIAKNRDDIPNSILQLRSDLTNLRRQLYNYTNELKGIKSQLELSILQKDVNAAIKTYSYRLFENSSFFSDTVRLIVDMATKPIETPTKIFNPNFCISNEYPILFGNSNYKRLRGFLKLDNINTNICNFLNNEEIKNIQKSESQFNSK